MSVLLIVGPKWTLAASLAAPGKLRWVCRPHRWTDRQTYARARPYITLSAKCSQSTKMNSLGKDAHNTFYLMAILLKTTKLMPLKLRP